MDKHVNSSDNMFTVKHGWDCGSNPAPDEHHKHEPGSINDGLTHTLHISGQTEPISMFRVSVRPHCCSSWRNKPKWQIGASCFGLMQWVSHTGRHHRNKPLFKDSCRADHHVVLSASTVRLAVTADNLFFSCMVKIDHINKSKLCQDQSGSGQWWGQPHPSQYSYLTFWVI